MSIFLDANILFSGSNQVSNLHRLLHWLCGKEELVTSLYVAHEAERNILAKRPEWQKCYRDLMRNIRLVPRAVQFSGLSLGGHSQG